MTEPIYPRDLKPWELEPYYSRHIGAMTAEGLHEKSDIAEQLAWRDQQLARIRATEDAMQKLAVVMVDQNADHYVTHAAGLAEQLEATRAERDEARAWVGKLTSTECVLTCVYCGHGYPPGTPEHGDAVLTAHIATCQKHPMRALTEQLEAAVKTIEAARPCCGLGSVAPGVAARERLAAALADFDRVRSGR